MKKHPNRKTYLNRKNSRFFSIQSFKDSNFPDPEFKEEKEDEKRENSLLTLDSKVPGPATNCAAISTKDLENSPAIYAIRCLINNKHYVGETKNLKNRFYRHTSDLRLNKAANREFQSDFNKFGLAQFELIVFASREAAEDYTTRWTFQNDLQNELISLGYCYNLGKEVFNPQSSALKRGIPTSPGVYGIRCLITGAIYIGETADKLGLSGRWSKHQQKLNQGKGINKMFQEDWNSYGAQNFEFLVFEQGFEWNDKEKRKKRETELILEFREEGQILYNVFTNDEERLYPYCLLSAKESILKNQTEEFRDFIRRLNTGRPNLNKTGVFAEGKVFLSMSEASNYFGVERKVIRNKIQSSNPNYLKATPQQIEAEIQRRQNLGIQTIERPFGKPVQKKHSGFPKPVQIDGKFFPSISKAAQARGVSPQAISKALKKGRPGFFFVDEEGNPIQNS